MELNAPTPEYKLSLMTCLYRIEHEKVCVLAGVGGEGVYGKHYFCQVIRFNIINDKSP